MAAAREHRWQVGVGLIAVVIVGAALRLYHLDSSTIGHIEIYVPGIDLPYELSDPRPRHSIASIVTGTVAAEPHPPAYYVFMLGWTKCFGTSAVALRLPSVLCGVASILLLYQLGTLAEGHIAALLSALFMALNGESIFWSQTAKMYSMAVLLGLLSTVCLLKACSASGRQRMLFCGLYAASTLTGLATVVYFWPLFLTQIVWSARECLARRAAVADIIRVQTLIFILASPLWALVAYQGRRPSYIETGIWNGLRQFLGFGFLFEPDEFAPIPLSVSPVVTTATALLGALLLVVRLRFPPRIAALDPGAGIRLSPFLAPSAAAAAAVSILAFAVVARSQDPSRTPYIAACSALPVLLAGLDVLFQRRVGVDDASQTACGVSSSSLSVLLAIVPAFLIAAVSTVTPLFISSGVMLVAPYLILTLAGGLTWLCSHRQRMVAALGVFLALVVVAVHAYSADYAEHRVHHPLDYKGLADQWIPRIRDSDLIFTRRHWALTPIFYYLHGERFHFVGSGYEEAVHHAATGRIWVLAAEGMSTPPELTHALVGYEPHETIDALRLRAILYERATTANH